MMTLPSSIETYLREADFTGTEVLIIRNLLTKEAFTLRELASKTGKSTGVLDQATKKLLRKGIIGKERMNGTPKYSITSPQSIADFVRKDVVARAGVLRRRCDDIAQFFSTVEEVRGRPLMEFYEGEDGLRQAYERLHQADGEILQYLPVSWKEEEDPLRDFRKSLLAIRKERKMPLKIIAFDTPLARRFKMRDDFEFRQTLLIDAHRYPFCFEKIIVGDLIGFIHSKDCKASVMHFPQYAESERRVFHAAWQELQREVSPLLHPQQIPTKDRSIEHLPAKILRLWAPVGIVATLIIGITVYGLL